MVDKLISYLEELGYTFVTYNAEESTQELLRFFGEDSKGIFLEFQFYMSDGYLMDRPVGSKYWYVLHKTNLL